MLSNNYTFSSLDARPKKRTKEYRCVAANCEARGTHLYTWPSVTKDSTRHNSWTRFVREKRAADKEKGKLWQPTSASRLCFRHFRDEEFSNLFKYKSCPEIQCT